MKTILPAIFIVAVIVVAWWLATRHGFVSPLFLPTIQDFLVSFEKAVAGTLWLDIATTLKRALLGLGIACVVGIPVGLLLGYIKQLYNSFEFIIDFTRSVPTTALFPLFLLLFGVGDASKISMVAYGAIVFIMINTIHGVQNIRRLRLMAAESMGLHGIALFTSVIFPEALPSIATGFRLALSYSLIIAVVTEMFFGSNSGLGYRIINAQYIYDTPNMYVGIISAGLVGYLLNKIAVGLESKIIHWKGV